MAGNGVLAVAKIVAGFMAGSVAVISDGIDSALDVLTGGITLIAARVTTAPPDIGHPYGHSRAETIATRALAFLIFFAGTQLAIGSVGHLAAAEARRLPSVFAIWVTLASVVGKTALAVYKRRVGRRVNSAMLIADAENMRADIVISVGVLVGLILAHALSLPVIDSVIALLVSAYILVIAFRIFIDTTSELMEGHSDARTYRQIFDAVELVPGAEHPHRARIRSIGPMKIVDLDIEVDGALTVAEAHEIAAETERSIKAAVADVYDVLVHVEPIGLADRGERFGVSRRKLDAAGS